MQRIALITAPNSDGRRDFIKELTENTWGIGYSISEFPAAVQGQSAVADLCRSFDRVFSAADHFDVVALVRGGGGNTDFTAFDQFDVAEKIAACPKPVFTGIGHDRNVSVADVVCHTMLKTPTRCAAAITEHNLQFLALVQNSRTNIAQSAKRFIELGVNNISDQKRRLSNAIQWRIKQETDRLKQSAKHFELLYPKHTLQTGYALVRKDGKVVKSINDLTPGTVVEIRLADGTAKATITSNE
jgi:exodeoxyribonuclease VII large subunit